MAALTGDEPISASNLKALVDSGGLGGGFSSTALS